MRTKYRFMPRGALALVIALNMATASLAIAPNMAAADPLNLSGVDNESLLTIMQFNMEELFEAKRRHAKQEDNQKATFETDECNLNIGASGDETSDDSFFDDEPAIIIDGPIIVNC